MVFVIIGICAILSGLMLWGATRCWEEDWMVRGLAICTVGVVMAIATLGFLVNGICYANYCANVDAYNMDRAEARTAYVYLLEDMETLKAQDVTASETYLTVYREVTEFNKEVRKADRWNDTIWRGILCDPSYAGLEVIPLN